MNGLRALALWTWAVGLGAQEPAARDTTPLPLPREVAVEAAARFNAPTALRVVGRLDITSDQAIKGDVAVLTGPVTVGGHIGGHLTVINGDLELLAGATIDSGILVVGGALRAPTDTTVHVGGPTLVFAQRLRYRRDESEKLLVEDAGDSTEGWWKRWLLGRRKRNYTDITLSSAHTYNRVEGLPIFIGPAARRELPWGTITADALGIVRTQNFKWDAQTFGYRVGGNVQTPGNVRFKAGLHVYDEVAPVENWQLGDGEVGLASFFFRRDYRDYYDRHGGSGSFSVLDDARGTRTSVTLSFANENWGARAEHNPFALFPTNDDWRPNPTLDDGTFRLLNLVARLDTRNSVTDIWSGWYATADLEYGNGHVDAFGPRSPPSEPLTATGPSPIPSIPAPGDVAYTRLFLDVRRYNRLAPNAQLNIRAVLAGWVGGDPLPLERRLSVGGPGTIPGFDFRSAGDDATNVASCSATHGAPAGTPAECERIALLQGEFRDEFHFGFRAFGHRIESDGAWVLFGDAGRGWQVGPRVGALQYPADAFPALHTFMTDVGVGGMIEPVGIYVAKALSRPEERLHFVIRVRRTF